jgi:hypothetical protein
MLRPFLLVGAGGSGGKTLRALKLSLERRLTQVGWEEGFPLAWQFLHIDTPGVQDGADFPAPFLPGDNYLSIVAAGLNYDGIYAQLKSGITISPEARARLMKPLPDVNDARDLDLGNGAGAYRSVGRAVSAARLKDILSATKVSVNRLEHPDAQPQLNRLGKLIGAEEGGGSPEPIVILVSSIAGGSGAGIFIDVAEAIKASTNKEWVQKIYSLLYAPDVFSGLSDGSNVNFEANALGAMAEAVAGRWISTPSQATEELYQSQGLVRSKGVSYSLGAWGYFLVGRKNANGTDFVSQNDTYFAIGSSLTTWLLDDKIQDQMNAYARANFKSQTSAIGLPDATGLYDANKEAPAFSAIGFGRLSLGRDRFGEYASERLARAAIDRLLTQHLATDPSAKESTEEEWIKFHSDTNWTTFYQESGLNERGANDDVINDLRPNRETANSEMRNKIMSGSVQGLDKSGAQSLQSWSDKIVAIYTASLPSFLSSERNARFECFRSWTGVRPDAIMKLIARTASQMGLPVTVSLLDRLIAEVKEVADELQGEADQYGRIGHDVIGYVSQSLREGSAGQSDLKPDHPAVMAGVQQALNIAGYLAESDLRTEAKKLLLDFKSNFLDPLRKSLSGAAGALRARIKDPRTLDDRVNPYHDWPMVDQETVPKRFNPAANEHLLVKVEAYPDEFVELLRASVSEEKQANFKSIVIGEVIQGSFAVENLTPERSWSLFEVNQPWIPVERDGRLDFSQGAQQARFFMEDDPQIFVSRARKWLTRPGTAVAAYLDETLGAYLSDPSVDRAVMQQRGTDFKGGFSAALKSSAPLADFNAKLLQSVHGKTLDKITKTLVSSIPFGAGSNAYELARASLIDVGIQGTEADALFKNVRVQHIEIFTTTTTPFQPLVYDSLMKPIAAAWDRIKGDPAKRFAFMQWRRARTLSEALPIMPLTVHQMLKGYFVSQILSYFDQDVSRPELGPKISIWCAEGNLGYQQFPHPLFYPGKAPIKDNIGVLLESVNAALLQCSIAGTLTPLIPYQRLIELGQDGEDADLPEVLANWILLGQKPNGSPNIDPERAGAFTDTPDVRRLKILDYLAKRKLELHNYLDVDPNMSVHKYPVSWELEEQIIGAIEKLYKALSSLDINVEKL